MAAEAIGPDGPPLLGLVGRPYTWPAQFLGYEAQCLGRLKDT